MDRFMSTADTNGTKEAANAGDPTLSRPGMNGDEFRKAAHAAIEDVIGYFSSLPTRRVVSAVTPGYLAPQLPRSAPEAPERWRQDIQPDIESKIMPGLTHWQSPRFMAFFPATVTFPSILGELYSAAFTAPAFNWLCSPACTELETVVLDWVARMLDLPPVFHSDSPTGGGGVIQGSASEAIVVAMVAARERAVRAALERDGLAPARADDPPERVEAREDRAASVRGRLVALGSEQAHSSTHKAANVLGLRYRSVAAGAGAGYAMTGQALRGEIERCRARGLVPFYVTATLGTTATCAVDDFEGIMRVRREQGADGLWVHVDAAYAGAALVCEEMREGAGARWLGEFDSFDVNMHKWLLVNFDASCLYVRSRSDLLAALSITPSYLVNPAGISGLVTDYRDWQIPLGRRFRALKIWFVLRAYGVAALRDMVRAHVRLGESFAGWVRDRPDVFRLLAGPAYALTVLTCRAPGRARGQVPSRGVNGRGEGRTMEELNNGEEETRSEEAEGRDADNAFTKMVYERLNEQGDFFLTSTVICGVYAIRVVSANEAAEEKYVRGAFDALVSTAETLRRETLEKK